LILSARLAGPMQASRHAASITADVTAKCPAKEAQSDYFGLFEPLNVPLAGAGVVHVPVISRPVELIVPLKDASTGPLLAHRHVTALSVASPATVNFSSVPPITQLPVSVLPSCLSVTDARGALSPSLVVSLSDHTPDTSAALTD
jgi:hypothetical protein